MIKKLLFTYIIYLTSWNIYCDETSPAELINEISGGPNINFGCDNEEKKFKKGQSFIETSLRNDAFAVPVTYLKNKYLIVWDLGETHGSELKIGHTFKSGEEIQLRYSTRLFTDVPWDYRTYSDDYRLQTFTSEQKIDAQVNNFKSTEKLKYSFGLGVINFDSTHDESAFLASGQQKILHHQIDKALGVNLIDFDNEDTESDINGTGILISPQIGKSIVFSKNVEITPYLKAQLTNISPANSLSAGAKINASFFGSNNDALKLELDVPFSVYKDINLEKIDSYTIPKFTISTNHKNIEMGYSLEVPFGNWQQNIPQNIPTYVYTSDLKEISDNGEMGSIFIKIKK